MKYPYWYGIDDYANCQVCKKKKNVFCDAVDCVIEGVECIYGFEGFRYICEKCLRSKANFHLKEFHTSVDLV